MSNDEDSIRLVVMVTKDSHPELFNELRKRDRSFRAERIRTLATISLMGVQAGVGVAAAPPSIAQTEAPSAAVTARGEKVDPEEERLRREQEQLEQRKRGFKDSVKLGFKS